MLLGLILRHCVQPRYVILTENALQEKSIYFTPLVRETCGKSIVYLAVLIMSLIALLNKRNGSENTQNVNKASSPNDSQPDDTTESTGGKRQRSSDTSPRINAQKKSKEGSPEVNFGIVASIDQEEVPNEETPSEMAAILETSLHLCSRFFHQN